MSNKKIDEIDTKINDLVNQLKIVDEKEKEKILEKITELDCKRAGIEEREIYHYLNNYE